MRDAIVGITSSEARSAAEHARDAGLDPDNALGLIELWRESEHAA